MAVTVNVDLSWDGKMGETVAKASDKNLKGTIKDMTGAIDVRINSKKVLEKEDISKPEKSVKPNKKKKKERRVSEDEYYE